jgi:hypothetical protein
MAGDAAALMTCFGVSIISPFQALCPRATSYGLKHRAESEIGWIAGGCFSPSEKIEVTALRRYQD